MQQASLRPPSFHRPIELSSRRCRLGREGESGRPSEGVRVELSGEQRTNYPLTMAVDDIWRQRSFSHPSRARRSIRARDRSSRDCPRAPDRELLDDRPAPAGASATPTCDDLLLKLSLVRPAERQRVTYEFNATSQQIDFIPAIVQFERQAARIPAACAIQFEGDSLSTRRSIACESVRPPPTKCRCPAGACSSPSGSSVLLDLIVALLGIHKAGGAYVPLDPAFPEERLRFVLADSAATVLVTSGDSVRGIDLPDGVRVVDLRRRRRS